jgi:hypothetical protein
MLPPLSPASVRLPQPPQQRGGKTYLVYSSYPNGAPVDNVGRKDAKDAIQSDSPGIQIDERHLVFGRVKVGKKDTGAVVYPISDSDARLIENTVKANKNDVFRTREEIDNKIIPGIIEKDMAKGGENVVIYDMAKGRVLMPNELANLSKNNEEAGAPAITTSRGKALASSPEGVATSPPHTPKKGASARPGQSFRPSYPQQRFLPAGSNTARIDFLHSGEGNDYLRQQYHPSPMFRPLAPGQHAPPFPED